MAVDRALRLVATVLALCGALGCAGHHGRNEAAAGRAPDPAGSSAPAPEAGREPVAEAGRGGTVEPPMETAGRGAECELRIGECFAVLPLGFSVGDAFAADVDGDGDADLIAPGTADEGSWFELTRGATRRPLQIAAMGEVAYGDVTGDDIADEVRIELLPCGDCEDVLSINVAEGDGTGRFEGPEQLDICPVGFSHWEFWLADLDGDGDSEYLLDSRCGDEPKELRVFDTPFSDWRRLGRTVEALAAADIDGDSKVDIVAVEHPSPAPPQLILLRGEGGLRFSTLAMAVELPEGHGYAVQILDFDGDGGRDIVVVMVSDDQRHTSLVMARWAAGALELGQTIGLAGSVHRVALANLDADCGDELVALRPHTPGQALALFEVDPIAGTAVEAHFPEPPPDLYTLVSVSAPNGRDHRVFAHTADNEIAELAPSSCGPPTD